MLHATLDRHFELERDRLPLWLAVGLGIGIGLYFSFPEEPQRAVLWWAPVLVAAVLLRVRLLPVWGPLAAFSLSITLGASLACWRADQVAAAKAI